jgi:carboxyl-terminal processing protease
VETLRDGSGLKLTIARYYTPSGRSIQAKGIEPDIVLKHRRIDIQDRQEEEGLIKEKDLENHLEAEPDQDTKEEKDSSENKPNMEDARTRIGPLKLEELQADNQIMHALEILTSYEIFKSLNS